jgi:hypothetical protein
MLVASRSQADPNRHEWSHLQAPSQFQVVVLDGESNSPDRTRVDGLLSDLALPPLNEIKHCGIHRRPALVWQRGFAIGDTPSFGAS